MPKLSRLNKDYCSPLEIIGISIFDGKLYKYFYPEDYRKYKHGTSSDYKVIEGFHTLTDMGKDFVNTFRPYKTWYHIAKEFLQPLRGIGNILRGVSILILAVVEGVMLTGALLGGTFIALIAGRPRRAAKICHHILSGPGRLLTSWFIDGVSSVVRGITQIVFTPIVPLKILLRGVITFFSGWQKFGHDAGMKKILEMHSQSTEEQQRITKAILVEKYEKAKKQGRKVPFNYNVKITTIENGYYGGAIKTEPENIADLFTYKEPQDYLTHELLPFFDAKRYEEKLSPEQKLMFSKELQKLDPILQKEDIKKLLKLNSLYVNLAKITLLMAKRKDSPFSASGIKDVVSIIADYTMREPINPPPHLINLVSSAK